MTIALPGRDRMLSRDIMDRLVEEAARTPRAEIRLATLQRLEVACDDIVSGRARKLASEVGIDDAVFGPPNRPRVDSKSIHHYVRMRARIDAAAGKGEATEWKGPHEVTIRADRDGMANFVQARRAESAGLARRRPKRTRARHIDEIVARIADEDDRLQVMHAIEDGYKASRRYAILVAALRTIPGVDLDKLLKADGVGNDQRETEILGPLGLEERRVLVRMLARLVDAGHMREFGLRFDGSRLRMSMAPGTELLTKTEFDLLRSLARHDA